MQDTLSQLSGTRRTTDHKRLSKLADKLAAGETVSLGLLGSGNYSSVYECPWDENLVVKVGQGQYDDGDIMEDGWLSWAAFCMTMHKEYPGRYKVLPVIHCIEFREGMFVALMKRYDMTYSEYLKSDVNYTWPQIYKQLMESDIYHPIEVEKGMEWLQHPLCPELCDVHNGNIMLNVADKSLVITDPCSDDYTLVDKRIELFRELGVDVAVLEQEPELPESV